MQQVSLATYTVRVRRSHQREGEREWENLGSIGGPDEPADLLEFLRDFLGDSSDYEEDPNRQSLLVVDDYTISGRTAYGFVTAGPWGAAAEIVNHRTRQLTHTMSGDEAQLIPFFFLVDVAPDRRQGLLMLQRLGGRGIKTHLGPALSRAFRAWKPGYLLELWKHVPGQILEELIRGGMRQVEVISYDTPTDLADLHSALRDGTNEWPELQGEIKTQITAKRGKRFPLIDRFRDVITGARTFHEVREELGVGDGRIRIVIDHQGKERTIDLADPGDISPFIDITDEVRLVDGHPDREEMIRYALELLPDLVAEVRGRYSDE